MCLQCVKDSSRKTKPEERMAADSEMDCCRTEKSDEVWFNVSYTPGMGIAAIADVPVGIDVQKVRSLNNDVLSGICSDGEYQEHFRAGSRGRCQLFSLKESYEKAKNGLGIVWPSTYAEYDKEFNLKRDCGERAFLSCCLPVAKSGICCERFASRFSAARYTGLVGRKYDGARRSNFWKT